MNICLIGNGISTLLLAKTLASRNIKVSIYGDEQTKKKTNYQDFRYIKK